MSGGVVNVEREYVAWVEMVPLAIAKGWARTFGMRPTLGALKCLVYAGGMWPLLSGYGMEACPHGFCVARARVGVASGGAVARTCSIPDTAEACACRASVPVGSGWCYLDGVEVRDRRTASALLGQDPAVQCVREFVPEFSVGLSWDGEVVAHAHGGGRYALVDLPPEVLVGRPATCRALGFGHLASEYCEACRITGQSVPRIAPRGAACGVDATGEMVLEASRVDKRDMSNHDGQHDALWIRSGGSVGRCAVEFPEHAFGPVRACACESPDPRDVAVPQRVQQAVAGVPGEALGAGGAWRRLEVVAPVSWTTVFRPGEIVYTGKAYVRCVRVTVVHVTGQGSLLVHARRDWFSVRSHSRVTDKRMRHMRFNVGGFTHWKILDKFEPDVVWRPWSVAEVTGSRPIRPLEGDRRGLGTHYRFARPPDGGLESARLSGALYGYAVQAGDTVVSLSSLVLVEHHTAWVYQGGERACAVSIREFFSGAPSASESASVFSLEDDYELDDGGPSSGESDYSAGHAVSFSQ